jgi:hypothetical protein
MLLAADDPSQIRRYSGMPNASCRIRASWRNPGARPVRRAGLPGGGLPQQAIGAPARIVEDAEAHPFELGMRGARKRSAPATPRGSKTAHADFLMVLSSAPTPPQPTPAGQSTVFTAREPPFEVAAAMPWKTAQ